MKKIILPSEKELANVNQNGDLKASETYGRCQNKVVVLGGAHLKVDPPPIVSGAQTINICWGYFFA